MVLPSPTEVDNDGQGICHDIQSPRQPNRKPGKRVPAHSTPPTRPRLSVAPLRPPHPLHNRRDREVRQRCYPNQVSRAPCRLGAPRCLEASVIQARKTHHGCNRTGRIRGVLPEPDQPRETNEHHWRMHGNPASRTEQKPEPPIPRLLQQRREESFSAIAEIEGLTGPHQVVAKGKWQCGHATGHHRQSPQECPACESGPLENHPGEQCPQWQGEDQIFVPRRPGEAEEGAGEGSHATGVEIRSYGFPVGSVNPSCATQVPDHRHGRPGQGRRKCHVENSARIRPNQGGRGNRQCRQKRRCPTIPK